MENASKALLIAGAILIVILLIAVGMMVYNGAKGSIDKAIGSMSSTEKDIHNKQFEPYIKSGLSGSNLKTLYSKVISNNGDDENIKVNISNITRNDKGAVTATAVTANTAMITEADLSTSMTKIKTNASALYNLTAIYTNGVITGISVEVAHQ